ncbi:MAG: ABC transporter permease subunit, partial [Terrimicrobiaceae bacterium]|nr:ABC transporter permease subunit [Terrimicrobiaceae bacterium]
FLAAIYIAPMIERQVPSLLLVTAGVPVLAAWIGWIWSLLPVRVRRLIPEGFEWLAFLPVLALAAWALWSLGPAFERLAFVTTDPETGRRVADFRYWWPHATGASFDQRNSMVVGFMMGFAVIPIIFTISEDALSNVPAALKTASMACGASRWQTTRRVVIPTASAGIFSALMVGLGRAVGETMIVVMATGNTPIMEWNIFSGMRTLSANIAVELPEAPHNSTLYRTLFFGALLLFALTFVVNTVAEILRQHLREKFKTI